MVKGSNLKPRISTTIQRVMEAIGYFTFCFDFRFSAIQNLPVSRLKMSLRRDPNVPRRLERDHKEISSKNKY